MRLKKFIETSTEYYKKPAFILVPTENPKLKNFSDEEILKIFSSQIGINTIVICEGATSDNRTKCDSMNDMIALQSFIFSARKRFEVGMRPLLIICTHYYIYELEKMFGWSGVKSEILQYGNVLLKVGRPNGAERLYFNPVLGIKLRGKHQEVYSFQEHQYP